MNLFLIVIYIYLCIFMHIFSTKRANKIDITYLLVPDVRSPSWPVCLLLLDRFALNVDRSYHVVPVEKKVLKIAFIHQLGIHLYFYLLYPTSLLMGFGRPHYPPPSTLWLNCNLNIYIYYCLALNLKFL